MLNKIVNHVAVVGVIGLGYVGLPLAVAAAQAGFKIIGIDLDQSKVDMVNNGLSYVIDVDESDLRSCLELNKLKAYTDYSLISQCDVIDIAVPTPLSKSKTPDISYIVRAMEGIKEFFIPGKLIILESTTYPGTTRELIVNELSALGYKIDQDFWVAFSPERVDPGNKLYKTKNTPKIIGGATADSAKLSNAFYQTIIERTVLMESCEEAEMCKLLENTFRAVNIGFINEMAMLCDKMNINIWRIIEAAQTKPFGFMPFYPGPGIGGHCIPLDPIYLSWKAKHYGFYSRCIELASDINEHMPDYIVDKLLKILNKQKKPLNGSHILIIGMAYKNDVDDIRESPALIIYEKLLVYGARVSYYDPYVRFFFDQSGEMVQSITSLDVEALEGIDLVLLLTAHQIIDYSLLVKHAKLIFDTRNAFNGYHDQKIEVL